MTNLPPEIIAHVLSFASKSTLRACMSTSRQCHSLAQRILYANLELPIEAFKTLVAAVSSSQNSDIYLGSLVKSFGLYNANTDDDITSTQIATLLPTFSQLEELSLPYPIWERFPDLPNVLGSCKKLHTITCIPQAIQVLSSLYGRQLTSLTVIGRYTFLDTVTEIPSLFPNLVHLSISFGIEILQIQFLENMAIHCHNLDSLELIGCSVFPVQGDQQTIVKASSVSKVTISFANLDPTWLAHIGERYPNVRKLSVTAMGGRDRLPYSASEWEVGFVQVARHCALLSELHCQSLQTDDDFYTTRIFFDTFSKTADPNHGLKHLTLFFAQSFMDADLLGAAMCAGKTLTNLELKRCPSITMSGFKAAMDQCSALTELNLSVREFSPSILLICCPSIKSLKLEASTIIHNSLDSSEKYQQIKLRKLNLTRVKNANVFIDAISPYADMLCEISIFDGSRREPKDYRIHLPKNIIHNLDIIWMLGSRVEERDPFYFKLSQTSLSGGQPTVHWCIRSGEPQGRFHMVAPETVPENASYFDISFLSLRRLAFNGAITNFDHENADERIIH
ncbi:hypothetical protein INT43_004942 [Umbelopsis isabellina]|uniref:F-box domain-containing protein n=1 Tax=Mortierella isabellina TaxID=91625 RepID=A0A8H7U7Y0_MORIS|nr:hypothetical protein INT43_004942 [Umbelopsis isabellina]